ncbi:MAG: efflux RND transporter periplasmic adaptor subunit [Terriglobales bacterium]
MKPWKKVLLALVVILVLGGIVAVSVARGRASVVKVQTALAARRDIAAQVTASGQIEPKNHADISANSIGQIRQLLVKEGDRVSHGELVAIIDNVQQGADVASFQAAQHTAQAQSEAQKAALATAQADLQNTTAQLNQAREDWQRAESLYGAQLLSKADFQTKQTAYRSALAQRDLSAAKVAQARADVQSAQAAIRQATANLKRVSDVYAKTQLRSPLQGLVTYLPVHVGDTVVMGIQNQPGSLVMRVADMSVVTAELQVDETDIVNVKLGQPAQIKIDAYGDRDFAAHVTEVGDTAILRATGQAASDTNTGSNGDQAKDFKVVLTLDHPPANIRPGLSCTAKITTATAASAVTVPLQAVIERDQADLEARKPGTALAAAAPVAAPAAAPQPVEGLFVLRQGKAVFVPVATGVTGVDNIQILRGIKPGEQVIIGPYRALRTMRNYTAVKADNSVEKLSAQGPA